MKRVYIPIFLFLVSGPANAQTAEKKQYTSTYITTAPVIDGILNDAVWDQGTWMDNFVQHEPNNGSNTSQKTEFKILFDKDNIYAAFKAYDTAPDSIVSRLTRRDNTDGDLVCVIFDSFHDLRTAFMFGVSASGVKFDQVFSGDGQNEDETWDPNWWTRTSVNKEGWVAEMRIPLSQLRFDKNSDGVWGLEVARIYYRKNETDFWQHIPKDAPGLVSLFGEINGLENIESKKIFDVTPYGVAKAESFEKEEGNPYLKSGRSSTLKGGLDAKIGITNNMTMDLTINPDFGQVEADPSVVNLTAYETYYEEKRPFFIEGNNITNFNMGIGDGGNGNDNLFYSRRIGRRPGGSPDLEDEWYADVPSYTNILGAAKLTGKTGKGLSVGFVEAMTGEARAEIDTGGGRYSEMVEPFTNFFLGRVQKDMKDGNTIVGGIFTGTNRNLDARLAESMHKSAFTGGFDFTQYFKKKSWMFNLNAAFSNVNGTSEAIRQTQESSAHYFQRPDNRYARYDTSRTSLQGSGGRMQLMKLDGHWNFLGCVIWKTPGFEINDLGYMQQADNMLTVLWAGYNQWEPKGIYRDYRLQGDVFFVNNFGGDLLAMGLEFNPQITFRNYWSMHGYANLTPFSNSTDMLRGGPMIKLPGSFRANIGVSSDNRKKLNVHVYVNTAKGFEESSSDFDFGADITYKPINSLFFTLSPEYSKSFDNLQYITTLDYSGADRYVFSGIDRNTISASIRVNFNLTPDLTLQYWGQPYIASGKYSDHKIILDPLADAYGSRYLAYSNAQQTFNEADNNYAIDENLDGSTDYTFDNENFNYQFFLSNLVLRWEFNPGSSVYLVWSQSRDNSNDTGRMDYFNNMGDLFDRDNKAPHNVFLVKFSYRFGLK
jgi:hypothetical protein